MIEQTPKTTPTIHKSITNNTKTRTTNSIKHGIIKIPIDKIKIKNGITQIPIVKIKNKKME